MTMHKQLWLLAGIRAIRMFMISMPVIVLYWQDNGLLLRDIFILQVIFSVAVIVFEVPSGYFADRFGNRLSIILGSLAGTMGFFLYWAVPSYLGFVLAEIVLALSAGFMSGARDALMYDTLATYGETAAYKKWQGRQQTAGSFSEAIAAVAAGIVAAMSSVNTVLLMQWLIMLIAIPMAWSLRDMRQITPGSTPTILKILHGNFVQNVRLRWLTFFVGVLSASTLIMVWFVQPLWQMLEIDIWYFGYLWALLNILVGLGAWIAHRVERWVRFRTLFISLAVAPLVLYSSTAATAHLYIAVVVTAGFWLLRGISLPITEDYLQRECKDGERATVLSTSALVGRLVFSLTSPFLGWIGDIWSLQTAFAASGLVFGILSGIALAGMLSNWQRNQRML